MNDQVIPELLQAEIDALYQRSNQRLDDVLNGLRLDMLGNPAEYDSLSWLLTKKFMGEQIEGSFARDLLATALYRLAREEGR